MTQSQYYKTIWHKVDHFLERESKQLSQWDLNSNLKKSNKCSIKLKQFHSKIECRVIIIQI